MKITSSLAITDNLRYLWSTVMAKLNGTYLGKWRDLSSLINTAVPVCTGLFSESGSA